MRKVDDWDNWEKNRKKEKWRWILTGLAIIVLFKGWTTYVDFVKYTEKTVNKVFEIAISDYSKERYTTGKIDFFSDTSEIIKFELSEKDISVILTQLEDTKVIGMKKNDVDIEDIVNSYVVVLSPEIGERIFFHIGRDKNTQKIYLYLSNSHDNRKIADVYLMKDEELYNIMEELRKQAL